MPETKNITRKCSPASLLRGLGVSARFVVALPLLLVAVLVQSLMGAFRTRPIRKTLQTLAKFAAFLTAVSSCIYAAFVVCGLLSGVGMVSSLSYLDLSVVTVWGFFAVFCISGVTLNFVQTTGSVLCALGRGELPSGEEMEELKLTALLLFSAALSAVLVLISTSPRVS